MADQQRKLNEINKLRFSLPESQPKLWNAVVSVSLVAMTSL